MNSILLHEKKIKDGLLRFLSESFLSILPRIVVKWIEIIRIETGKDCP